MMYQIVYYIWRQKMQEIERLKEVMKKKGLSHEKLAHILGVSLGTVVRWLQNKSKPSDLALIQIKKFIDEHRNV